MSRSMIRSSSTLWGSLQQLRVVAAPLGRQACQRQQSKCYAVVERPAALTHPKWPTLLGPKQRKHSSAVQPTSYVDTETLKLLEATLGPLDNNPMVPAPKPVVVVISGPSGVGKDSVVARVKERREDLYFVVTATSRPKRPNEVEGKDYFFVAKEKFEEWIATDMLLEYATVYGDYKGIPRQQVDEALAAGTDVVLRIDVQGAATVKKLIPDAITIFITAESEAKLVTRLAARKTETMDKLVVRVKTAQQELNRIPEFDYVVVNEDGGLDACVDQISAIIDTEKLRVKSRLQGQQQQEA